MPKKYFEYFPTTEYTIDNFKNIKVKDVFRRVIVKMNKFENLDFQITRDQRPEMVADQLYDDPFYHWVLLLSNNIVDPINEWYMDDKFFNNYISSKYPNHNLRLNTNHFDSDKSRFFIEGEKIYQQGSSNTKTGTVINFDPDLLQITFKYDTGSQPFTKGSVVKATTTDEGGSNKDGAIIQVEKEINAIKYYSYLKQTSKTVNSEVRKTTESFIINQRTASMFSGSDASSYTEIDNYTYEVLENTRKSKIFYIPPSDIPVFENDFKQVLAGVKNG